MRASLFEENQQWAHSLAGWLYNNYAHRDVERDDWVQEAMIGFLDAVEKYDPSFATSFHTYAGIRMRGQIRDWMRSNDALTRDERRIWKAQQSIIEGGGSIPHDEIIHDIRVASLNIMVHDEEGQGLEAIDLVEEPGDEISIALSRDAANDVLMRGIGHLMEREAIVITLYYFEDMSIQKIGDYLGVTESRASQIHTRGLRRLYGIIRREISELDLAA